MLKTKSRNIKYTLSDIPLEQESGRKHLPVLMCLLVFLLIIVLGAVSSLGGVLKKWESPISQKITIEVVDESQDQVDIKKITTLLPQLPGIASFEIIKHEQVVQLLKPWIGEADVLKSLKLPVLIDVELDAKKQFDMAQAEKQLKEIAPNLKIESHAKWYQTMVGFTNSLHIVAYNLIGLILITIFSIISLMTRASLNVHKSTIDILRLMGARKQYIARYFQNSSFYLCLKGGLVGLLIAIPTLLFVEWMSQRIGIPQLFRSNGNPLIWGMFVSVPFIISGFAMVVSRLAVMGTLIRMDT